MSLLKSFSLGLTLIGLCTLAKAEVPVSYEMDGNIESRYLRRDGRWGSNSNWFEVSVSGCRSAIRTGGMGDKAIDYFEYVSDGTNSELLIKYKPRKEFLWNPKAPINQANVTINSGVIPEYGFGMITPVWVACASSCFFQKAGGPIEPIFFWDPGLREYHLKVKANWSLSAQNPQLPERVCDFTDGKDYNWEHGILKTEPLPKPFDKPATNCIFSVLSWTRLGDLHLPSKWQAVYYQPDLTNQTLEVRMIDTAYTTAVRSGTSRTSFEIQAPEYARITDCTLEAQGVPVRHYTYISTNGNILSLSEIRKQRDFAPILQKGLSP